MPIGVKEVERRGGEEKGGCGGVVTCRTPDLAVLPKSRVIGMGLNE